jgi:hypothetical protein
MKKLPWRLQFKCLHSFQFPSISMYTQSKRSRNLSFPSITTHSISPPNGSLTQRNCLKSNAIDPLYQTHSFSRPEMSNRVRSGCAKIPPHATFPANLPTCNIDHNLDFAALLYAFDRGFSKHIANFPDLLSNILRFLIAV